MLTINTSTLDVHDAVYSGPSWQAVPQVHRDAYGVAGTLVAVAIFLSGASGSLDKVGAVTHANTQAILCTVVPIRCEVGVHSSRPNMTPRFAILKLLQFVDYWVCGMSTTAVV